MYKGSACWWFCALATSEPVDIQKTFMYSTSRKANPIFFHGTTASSGPRPPHCWDFTITLRHTTLGRTLLDKWSAGRKDLHLTTHNTLKRETFMTSGRIRTRNPSKRPATDQRLSLCGHCNLILLHFYVIKFVITACSVVQQGNKNVFHKMVYLS
jgi:hypothetical protein